MLSKGPTNLKLLHVRPQGKAGFLVPNHCLSSPKLCLSSPKYCLSSPKHCISLRCCKVFNNMLGDGGAKSFAPIVEQCDTALP